METNQNMANQSVPTPPETMTQEMMLQAIYENSRKTMNYMKWQLYITIVLIVLPLLAMAVMLPMALKSLGTLSGVYGGSLIQ
jgi:hypothetical protein